MCANTSTQNKPLRKKLTRLICELLAYLILLEIGLRAGGLIFVTLQNHRNAAARQGGTYRIMCVGNSTTALGGAFSYPSQLEQILNRRHTGMTFSVINKGVPGISTAFVMSHLEENLSTYHPDMVIVMMGIDYTGKERNNRPTVKVFLFLSNLRTYKLMKLLWRKAVVSAKAGVLFRGYRRVRSEGPRTGETTVLRSEATLKKAVALNPDNDDAYFALGMFYKQQGAYPQAKEAFRKAIELNPAHREAYLALARIYYAYKKYSQAEELLKKAISLDLASDAAYIILAWIYSDRGEYAQAEAALKKAVELNPYNDNAYGALSVLYEAMRKPELTREYTGKTNTLRLRKYNPTVVRHYRKLKDILDRKGIRLVCVQYPMRSIEPLKMIFAGNAEGVVFVDNERIFRDAVKNDGYNVYFKDRLGSEFGHGTAKGNALLAGHISDTILKEVFHR